MLKLKKTTENYHKDRKIWLLIISLAVLLAIIIPFIELKIFGLSHNATDSLIIMGCFLLIGWSRFMYGRGVDKRQKKQAELEERLQETFKYIGSINLQLSEMKKVFASINKYPENKKDIQTLFAHAAERILGIINADWVWLKIINKKNGETLHEYSIARGNRQLGKIKIDNAALLDDSDLADKFFLIKSNQDNFNIKAYGILPAVARNSNQEFLLNSIINQLEMLFIIFDSLYYKKEEEKELGKK